jgi:hypothetical protein
METFGVESVGGAGAGSGEESDGSTGRAMISKAPIVITFLLWIEFQPCGKITTIEFLSTNVYIGIKRKSRSYVP